MVHSFAFAHSDKSTDFTKAQTTEDRKVYADADFTALAEQKPRVAVAKSHYPEMGDDKDDFLRFFGSLIDIARYVDEVDKEVAGLIAKARSLKVDDVEVFDAIEVRKTQDSNELLAFGQVQFGNSILYFPIVQWRVPGDNVDTDGHTSIEEIKALHRKEQQKREDDEKAYLEAEKAKELRNQKVWDYPLLTLALLMSAAMIYAPLAESAGWLAVGYLGSFVATAAGMVRTMIDTSLWAKIALGVGITDLIGAVFCVSYLTHIGVIK